MSIAEKTRSTTRRKDKINLYSKHIRLHQTISSKALTVNTNDKKSEQKKGKTTNNIFVNIESSTEKILDKKTLIKYTKKKKCYVELAG